MVGDGAEWIRNRATMFVHRCAVLDFWHALEHPWTFARLRYGDDSAQADRWVHRIAEDLRDGKVEDAKLAEPGFFQSRSEGGRDFRRGPASHSPSMAHRGAEVNGRELWPINYRKLVPDSTPTSPLTPSWQNLKITCAVVWTQQRLTTWRLPAAPRFISTQN
jgi:hypothetical protein